MSMQAPEVTLTRSGIADDHAHMQHRQGRQISVTLPVMPAFIGRWLAKLSGYLHLLIVLLGGISLATWTISDPSLTFANGSEAENWLGFWGASFADFTMQFLGFASIALLIPPAIWGALKLLARPLNRFFYRIGTMIVGLVFLAAALACISIPEGWPLQVGLGGVVGDAVLGIPRAFTGSYPGGILAVVLFILFAAPALWLMARSCNLIGIAAPSPKTARAEPTIEELVDSGSHDIHALPAEGRDWSALFAMPLGLLMHVGYSLRAMWRKRKTNKDRTPVRDTGPVFSDPAFEADETFKSQPMARSIEPGFDIEPPFDTETANAAYEPTLDQNDWPDADLADDDASGILERSVVETPSLDGSYSDDMPVPHTDQAQPEPLVQRVTKKAKPRSGNGKFQLPAIDLLAEQKSIIEDPSLSNEALEENARLLEGVLEDFGVKGQILKVRPGPVVTLYELEPAPGVKSSRVIGLAEDIARSMSAIAARVVVVPGRNAIGIELPNKRRETVYLREQISSKEFKKTKAKLAMCLGKTIGGEPVIADLAKMPHLLVAGTTGSGKSVAINTMILSLLYRLGPDKCKLIMIDPKMLELSIYDGIPHLLTPVVVDPKKAVVALKWTVREMEDRYKKMSKVGVRNIDGFNTRIAEAAAKGEVITRTVQTGFDRDTGEAIYEHEELDLEPMPFIVVIIDEMADLMMVAGKDIEGTVQRLAQMARAAGIHVIMATQRPSVDVITGTIKANFPTRISFQVTSKIDSRTILGEMGAEQLLGMGDMLYMAGGGRITRVHGPFVDDQEVEDIVNHLKAQGVPQYLEAVTEETEEDAESGEAGGAAAGGMGNSDDPYDQAVAIVLRDRKASTSYIQRRLSVGYNKAASLIERMEQEGLISPANHAGKREILVPAEDETI